MDFLNKIRPKNLVKLSIFPPTIITAPTSDNALLKPVRITISRLNLDSNIIVLLILVFEALSDKKYSFKRLY